MRHRLRATSDDSDQDLYEYLSADIGDATRHFVTAHFFLRATEDLDGETDEEGFFTFDSITDTFERDLNGRVYYAYLDVHRFGPLETGRVGRQMIEETPVPFSFDGVRVESKEFASLLGLQAGLYGGVPVHLFESSSEGDGIGGAYLQSRVWRGARARIDYTRIVDDYLLGTERSDLLGIGLRQRCGDAFAIQGQYDILESDSHSVHLAGTYSEPESDLQVQLSYFQLFETQRSLAIDVDSFFVAAQEYFPYRQVRLLVAKGLGTHSMIQAGADLRELEDEDDEGRLNREFRRVFLTPALADWPWPGVSAGVTFELWDVPGSDNGDIRTVGFDVAWKASERLKLGAGSSFALFKFDLQAGEEREKVRTTFAKAVYLLTKDLRVDVYGAVEDDDFEEFWTLKTGVTQGF
ncbi:MAG: hypothetical protein HYY16_17985 [Planctomycetes bacterium]|nr:hypothetical protein [Planctomycetota bacterium]